MNKLIYCIFFLLIGCYSVTNTDMEMSKESSDPTDPLYPYNMLKIIHRSNSLFEAKRAFGIYYDPKAQTKTIRGGFIVWNGLEIDVSGDVQIGYDSAFYYIKINHRTQPVSASIEYGSELPENTLTETYIPLFVAGQGSVVIDYRNTVSIPCYE